MKAKLITTFSIILISLFFTGFQVFAAENNESEDNDDESNITEQDDVQDVCSKTNNPDDTQIESENDEAVDEDQCSENDLVSSEEGQDDDDGDSDKESNTICHKDEDTKNPSSETTSDSDKMDSDKNEDQSESNPDEDGNQDAHQEEESSEAPSAVNGDQEDCNTDEDKESSQEESPSEDSSETESDSGIEDEDVDNEQPESGNEADEDSDEQQEDSSDETTDSEETDEEDDQQAVDESIESEEDNEDKVTEDNQADNDEDMEENDEGKDDSKSDKEDTQKAKKKNTIKEAKAKSGPPYKLGDRDNAIKDIKKKLNKIGFDGISVTNYYGDWTQTRVKQFQKNYGLKANGVVNTKTLNKLDEVYNSPYQFGKRNSNVTALKKKLNKTKFGGITVTNYYGSFTKQRVEEFQRFVGMSPNGIADSQTRSELDTYLSGYQKGDRSKAVVDIKKKLNNIGFGGITVTEYYGDWTQTRVKQFQKNYGLKANGVVNTKTLNKLDEVYNSPYKFGKRSKNVTAFKKKINKTQFGGITVTNYYGSFTKQRVEEFQRFVGLKANGIADSKTRSELDKYLSGYKKGSSSKAIANFKKKLNNIGFGGITVTNYFGDWTQTRVKQFQKYYGLQVDGAVGPSTMKKINAVYNSPFQKGKSHKKTAEIKKKLNDLGYSGITVTNYFGDYTKKQVQKFQRDYGLRVNGIADEVTRKKLDKIWDASDSVKETSYGLTLKQALNMQMKANPQSDKNYAYVSKEYIKNGRVTASALNVRVGPSAAYNAIGQLLEGAKVTVQSEVNGWYAISYSYSGWVSATPKDTEYYLNPNNFKNDDKQKFQFLDLSVTSGATKTVLNDYLSGKGTLAKQGQAFIDAGNKHGVNDVYLISHAIHETGNGSSTLASGIPVDKNGKITRDSNGKIAKTKQTVATVYNMYGIGAVDSCPIECGAKRAFDEGWTTPYKAIVGGASFIGNGYIDKGQNTLYKMRWNPAQMDKGNVTHQYATDVGWASKQVTTLYNLYQKLSFYKLSLDITKYK